MLSFEANCQASGCFVPAMEQEKWIERLAFMDGAGDRWWPIGGGVYIIHAIKRVQGMRLIMPKWERKAASRALAPLIQKTGPRREGSQKTLVEKDFGRD